MRGLHQAGKKPGENKPIVSWALADSGGCAPTSPNSKPYTPGPRPLVPNCWPSNFKPRPPTSNSYIPKPEETNFRVFSIRGVPSSCRSSRSGTPHRANLNGADSRPSILNVDLLKTDRIPHAYLSRGTSSIERLPLLPPPPGTKKPLARASREGKWRPITCVEAHPGGGFVAVGTLEGDAHALDPATLKPVRSYRAPDDGVRGHRSTSLTPNPKQTTA